MSRPVSLTQLDRRDTLNSSDADAWVVMVSQLLLVASSAVITAWEGQALDRSPRRSHETPLTIRGLVGHDIANHVGLASRLRSTHV